MGLFAGFQIVAEERKVLSDADELYGLLGSGGSSFLVNTKRGGWVTGDTSLYQEFSRLSPEGLLARYPDLCEPLLEQNWGRREYKEINPWTIKVADHCNMACTYCYEDAHPQVKKMSIPVADKIIDEMLALGQKEYIVLFHGGEPTLNMDVVRYTIRTLNERADGKARVKYIMQTNLMQFSEALHQELRSLGVTIGSSLDGIKEVNDTARVNLRGTGTHDSIVKNLERLEDKYLILTINQHNQDRLLESARHFVEDLGVYKFHFLPLLPHGRPNVRALVPDARVMADSMLLVFDYILDQWQRGVRISFRNLDDVIKALHAGAYIDACQACCLNEFKSQSITINYDGTFAPCDVSAGYPEYALGNILQCEHDLRLHMTSGRNFRVFKRLDEIEGCRDCPFKFSCAGGCEEESLHIGYERNHYCNFYYQIHAAVACNLVQLERMGYAAQVLGKPDYEYIQLV